MVAYHEAGHLLALYLLPHPTDDVFKASIIARRSSLGVVYHNPRAEYHTSNREKLMADIKVSLGGYVAEKLAAGTTSSGVGSDFQHAMGVAHTMVWRLGMGSKYLGDWEMPANSDGAHISESVRSELNAETNEILRRCAQDVEEILTKERVILDRFANELIKREELEYDDIEAIFAEYGKARMPLPTATKGNTPP